MERATLNGLGVSKSKALRELVSLIRWCVDRVLLHRSGVGFLKKQMGRDKDKQRFKKM